MKKYLFLIAGFVSGIIYLISCGGGDKVASTLAEPSTSVIHAIDVVFDNTVSKLVATTVQGAIEELTTKIAALEKGGDLSSKIVGEWSGREQDEFGTKAEVTFAFNLDGTASCSFDQPTNTTGRGPYFDQPTVTTRTCVSTMKWSATKHTLILTTSSPEAGMVFPIHYVDESNLELLSENGPSVLFLTK